MTSKATSYARRQFLSQCVALPLATSFVCIEPACARGDQSDELQPLLKYVPPMARYHREAVPEAENAWPILLKAKHVIQLPDGLFEAEGETTPWDEALTLSSFPRSKGGGLLHDVLLKHNAALRLIDQAAAKTKLQYPEPSGWKTFDRDTDDIDVLRNCFMLKTLRAKLAFHEERYSDAARDLCDLLRLSQMLACGDGLVVQWLIGGAVRSDVLRNLRRLSAARDVPSDVVKRALRALDEVAGREDGAARALRVELCCFGLPILMQIPQTKDIPELARGLMTAYVCHNPPKKQTQAAKNCERYEKGVMALLTGHPSAFDRQATVELGGKITADAIEQLKLPFLQRKRDLYDAAKKELADWPKPLSLDDSFPFYFTHLEGITEKLDVPNPIALAVAREKLRNVNNPLGKMLAVSNADTDFVSSASCTASARLGATRLMIALHLFERKNHTLPATLDFLVESKLLIQIPQDPFDGESFKYSAKRRVIWSVGDEGKNEGVIPGKEDSENPFDEDMELTWRVS
jgi:hypothetical protein